MSISSELSADENTVTIKISGRFDFSTHQEFMQAYKAHPKGEKAFIVDLAHAEYLDSSSMGMLLHLRENCVFWYLRVVLGVANDALRVFLSFANFEKLFQIE
ncbi:MAG: STAS domain-containing protein [Candidatus Thiodiazotropha sp.]